MWETGKRRGETVGNSPTKRLCETAKYYFCSDASEVFNARSSLSVVRIRSFPHDGITSGFCLDGK